MAWAMTRIASSVPSCRSRKSTNGWVPRPGCTAWAARKCIVGAFQIALRFQNLGNVCRRAIVAGCRPHLQRCVQVALRKGSPSSQAIGERTRRLLVGEQFDSRVCVVDCEWRRRPTRWTHADAGLEGPPNLSVPDLSLAARKPVTNDSSVWMELQPHHKRIQTNIDCRNHRGSRDSSHVL